MAFPQVDQVVLSFPEVVRAGRMVRRGRVLSSGIAELDALLPGGGFPCGDLSELLGEGPRHSLAAHLLAVTSCRRPVAYLAPQGIIQPGLIAALGGCLERCYFLNSGSSPASHRHLLWAAWQLLDSGLFAAVVMAASAWQDRSPLLDPLSHRRLRALSRKSGTAMILIFDPHPALAQLARPCALRLGIDRVAGGARVTILRQAGGPPGATAEIFLERRLPAGGSAGLGSAGFRPASGAPASSRHRERRLPAGTASSRWARPCVIWLEGLSIQLLVRSGVVPAEAPVAIHDGRHRIIQSSPAAAAQGIVAGLGSRQASARLGSLALFPDDPGPAAAAQRELAGLLLPFSPRVALWGAEEIVVDLAPAAHLFGGEVELARRVAQVVADAGFQCRLAVADSLAAARLSVRLAAPPGDGGNGPSYLAGREEESFIAAIPIARLLQLPELSPGRSSDSLLRRLAITTLGELAAVSRQLVTAALPAALAPLWLYAHRSEQLSRELRPVVQSERWCRRLSFTPPVGEVEMILPALQEALEALSRELAVRATRAVTLELLLRPERGPEVTLTVSPARPSRSPRLLLELFRLRFEAATLSAPLSEAHLILVAEQQEQVVRGDLFDPGPERQQAGLTELCGRLDSRFGRRQALFCAALADGRLPEERWQRLASGGAAAPPDPVAGAEQALVLPAVFYPDGWPLPAGLAVRSGRRRWRFEFFDPERGSLCRHDYLCCDWQGRSLLVKEWPAADGATRIGVIGLFD